MLFAQYKSTWLTAINNHSVAAVYLPRCVLFNSHMRQNAFYRCLKLLFEDLLPCYCYALNTYSRIKCSQVWPSPTASIGTDRSELQAYHCITPELWTWLACSVSGILSIKKLPLQELNRLIGIELLISAFLENFRSGGHKQIFVCRKSRLIYSTMSSNKFRYINMCIIWKDKAWLVWLSKHLYK